MLVFESCYYIIILALLFTLDTAVVTDGIFDVTTINKILTICDIF